MYFYCSKYFQNTTGKAGALQLVMIKSYFCLFSNVFLFASIKISHSFIYQKKLFVGNLFASQTMSLFCVIQSFSLYNTKNDLFSIHFLGVYTRTTFVFFFKMWDRSAKHALNEGGATFPSFSQTRAAQSSPFKRSSLKVLYFWFKALFKNLATLWQPPRCDLSLFRVRLCVCLKLRRLLSILF